MNLEFLLNNLITSGTKFSDPEAARKIKTLNIVHLISILSAPILGVFYFFIGATLLFYIVIFAALFMLSGMILLRMTRGAAWLGNYTIFILWVTLSLLAWNSGAMTPEGVIRPSWILNAGLILLAIFLNGYLSGTFWAVLVFIETGFIIYLFRAGYQFPNLIPPDLTTVYSLGVYLICLLAILSFAFLFEKEKDDALSREKEKSQALRESKRYIDDILERSPLPTFILDKSHRVIQWNRACEDLTGLTAEETLGKEVWEGFRINNHGSIADIVLEDPDLIMAKFGDAIVSHTDSGWFELEMALPRMKDGLRTVITAAPILDNHGTTRGAIQTIQEIRPPHPGDEMVEDGLYDHFPHPVFKVDAGGNISFWNRACEESFGYPASRMVGNSPLLLVAEAYRPVFQKTMEGVYQGESFSGREWTYRSGEGRSVYVLARAYPLPTLNGERRECVVVNTDVTALKIKMKKLEIYCSESKERLKNLTEEHDLLKRNIATFIRGKEKPPP